MILSVNLIAVDKIPMKASSLTQHSYSNNVLTDDPTLNVTSLAATSDRVQT